MDASNSPQLVLIAPIPYVHAECALRQLHTLRSSSEGTKKDRLFVFGTSADGLFSKDDGLRLLLDSEGVSNQMEIFKKKIPVYIYVSGTGYDSKNPGEHLLHRQGYIALRGIFAGWSQAIDEGCYQGPKRRRPSSTVTDTGFEFYYEVARLEVLRVKFPFNLINMPESSTIYAPFWKYISKQSLNKYEAELQAKIAESKL